jgi:hypothetical protein
MRFAQTMIMPSRYSQSALPRSFSQTGRSRYLRAIPGDVRGTIDSM